MSEAAVTVRDLASADEAAWRRYWGEYQAFYEVSHPEEITAETWRRLTGGEPGMFGLVAEAEGRVVGIANCVLHLSTWSTKPFCYLNDLYVDPNVRGRSIGKALIDEIIARAERNGWARVYWMTAETNTRARRLYDRYGPASGFISYVRKIG